MTPSPNDFAVCRSESYRKRSGNGCQRLQLSESPNGELALRVRLESMCLGFAGERPQSWFYTHWLRLSRRACFSCCGLAMSIRKSFVTSKPLHFFSSLAAFFF